MRIVNRKQFLELPSGTLYTKYESGWNFGELAIKKESCGNDWRYIELIGWPQDCSGSSELFVNLQQYEKEWRNDLECSARDGFYEEEQLFAIYDKEDVQQLITKLQELL